MRWKAQKSKVKNTVKDDKNENLCILKTTLNKLKSRDPLGKRIVPYLTHEGFNSTIWKSILTNQQGGKNANPTEKWALNIRQVTEKKMVNDQ